MADAAEVRAGEAQAEARYQALLEEIRAEFPRFKIIVKSRSRLHRAIHHFLRVVTFGGMTAYLNGYQTTIGARVYVTDDWDGRSANIRYCTMRHELVHIRQFRKFTLPGMALLYVLLPLPLGLAYFRARFEWQAYTESIRANYEVHGRERVEADWFRESIISQFTGPAYGWMWPFRKQLERWYDLALAELS
jgi:hypothetical protein